MPKMTFLGPGPTLGSTYLIIVDQIQMKLVLAQTYLGKVLLQSILATLDFPLSSFFKFFLGGIPLSSYNPLKMRKKVLKWSI